MGECSYARCIQEKRAIKKELQSWTKNMVYVLGLERVAEELMGRRKWKLYQDTLIARHPADRSPSPQSDPSAMPAAEPPPQPPPQPPAIKIKTIEQINTTSEEEKDASKPETTILEALIKRPSTHPLREERVHPEDWKPQDKCYFCVDEEPGRENSKGVSTSDGRATASPAHSESSNSSISGDRSPSAPPALLAHLLQLQNHSPQAIAQFQSMMAALTALGGFMPPALQQAWYLRIAQQNHLMQQQSHVDRITTDMGEKVSVSSSPTTFHPSVSSRTGPSGSEQPLDLSAKSSSSSTETSTSPEPRVAMRVPPIDPKFHDRLKRSTASPTNLAGVSSATAAVAAAKRAYTEDELQNALRDIRSGRLGTRKAAALYRIPRSTLRNKVYKLQDAPNDDDDKDSNADDDWPAHAAPYIRSLLLADSETDTKRTDESPTNFILKVPTFPPPDDKDSSPTTTTPVATRAPNFFADPTPPTLPLPPLSDLDPSALRGERLFSLRDVIAKSISRKFQGPPNSEGVGEMVFDRSASSRPISVIKNFAAQDPQRNSHMSSPTSNNINNNCSANSSQGVGGKGTRPKRGKYRNYDRDSLVEAVKAVQRGEMSVHRAGSYYGVPHSTLEYKVKERHLMRPRKREPKNPPPDGTSTTRPAEQRPRPTPKPQIKSSPSPTATNGLKSSNSFDPGLPSNASFAPGAYPFWARASLTPAFSPFPPAAPELYASHMMQRLREESTTSRPEPPSANGSFLEGIIRSGLERAASERPNSESEGSPPPARRPRLDSSDHGLAADMRDAVQRLRAERQPAPDRPDVPAHL